jgi:hypothetical protein
MLTLTHNLPQAAPNTIANDGVSEMTRSNEAHATKAGVLDPCRAEDQQPAAPYEAFLFYTLVFGCARQAALLWK